MGKQFAQEPNVEKPADELTPEEAAEYGRAVSDQDREMTDVSVEPDPEHVDNRQDSKADFGGVQANSEKPKDTKASE